MSWEYKSVQGLSLVWGRLAYYILLICLVAAGFYAGGYAYRTMRAFAADVPFRTVPMMLRSMAQPVVQATVQAELPSASSPSFQPVGAPKIDIYPDIESKERINILFLGIDQRPGESTACRTDTMILVSVDPQTHSVSLLSIPRDLWINIPLAQPRQDKINTAHYWGEITGYPGGGPALAMRAVYDVLGIRAHYYVRLNFTGFEHIIDRIGGIDVNVPTRIDDTRYPNGSLGYEHLIIEAGSQHFDGKTALKYARTRYGNDDFGRMARQREIILAVQSKVLGMSDLPQLISQLPQMSRDLGDSLSTDIPVDMMFTLANLAREIKRQNMNFASIDRRMTQDYETADGQQVLLLQRNKAQLVIDQLFKSPTPEAQATEVSQIARLEAEKARIMVYNGTKTFGLARRVCEFLAMQGFQVSEPQNADSDYTQTVLHVYADKPFTIDWLVNILAVSPNNVVYHQTESSEVDISIIIGQDFPVAKIK